MYIRTDFQDDTQLTSTTDVSEYNCTTTTTYSGCYIPYKYEPSEEFLNWLEENLKLEWIKSGWFNPIKILVPKKPMINNIKKVIRNQLPIKFRYD